MLASETLQLAALGTPPRRPLTIVHGVLTLEVGGLERMALDLACRSAAQGDRVSIVCIERQGELADRAKAAGVAVYCLDKPPGRSRQAIDDATALLQSLRPDVMHSHHIGVLWYLGSAARRLGLTNIVHTEHCDQVTQEKNWLRKLHARAWWWHAGKMAREFCCVSEDIADSVRRYGTLRSSRVRVVGNGIATEVYNCAAQREVIRNHLGIRPGTCVIGTVGRLAEVKRQDRLIRALAELRKSHNVCLVLVGDGPLRQELEQLARELNVAKHVHFAGYQAHPEHYLAALDVFALPSRHEGLPLALLEAWASSLPVVASAVGGILKVVEHDRTGLLVKSDAELTAALRGLIGSDSQRQRLAAAGVAEVQQRFSAARMAQEYQHLYAAGLPPLETTRCCNSFAGHVWS